MTEIPKRIRFLDLRAVNREIQGELSEAFAEVVDSGWYVLGPKLGAFEEAFAEFVGAKYCVGVGSGLDAISLALLGVDVGPGDEVLVPSHTYIATWFAVTHVGAIPVPVEPEPDLLNMDPERIEAAITPQTRAIVPVHLYGHPAEMDRILQVAQQHDLPVIEDAAQSHGARYRGRATGALGDAAAFSFYPTKNLGALGDGGAVTTSDSRIAERVRLLRNHGARRRYVHELLGRNSRLDELQARLLHVKLSHLEKWNAERQRQARIYLHELASADLVLPVERPWAEHVWHLFVIRTSRRQEIARALETRGIETLIHYPLAPHLQDAYAHLGIERGSLPLAERTQEQVLSLPIGPHLADRDIAEIAATIQEVLASSS